MTRGRPQGEPLPIRMWLGLCLFLAVAGFLLWDEHKAHVLGALPYALLLLCLVMHFFMHRGHSGAGADHVHHEKDGGAP